MDIYDKDTRNNPIEIEKHQLESWSIFSKIMYFEQDNFNEPTRTEYLLRTDYIKEWKEMVSF